MFFLMMTYVAAAAISIFYAVSYFIENSPAAAAIYGYQPLSGRSCHAVGAAALWNSDLHGT